MPKEAPLGEMARLMIIAGIVLIVTGLVLLGIQKVPFLGKLPGDFLIKRENFTFYFPLATGIIISILISLILYLISKFR
jgi:thiosulfate reductase cytochrome b subunit